MSLLFDSVLEESQRAAVEKYPVPAYGHTRCYWHLLDSELRYLYLDPTCSAHMGEEAEKVIGTCLLDYVHPDEQKSARVDLGNVLDSRTLHGSVTRVRYARLSRIRAILGCNAPDPFPDADLVTVDDHYIACDVVINCVSDNVVLCFLHAIVDKGKADDDELNKTDWTNWCGTSAMTTDHAAGLYDRLHKLVPPSHILPDRIFQILINQPARPILFSWPPEGYMAGEFGKLIRQMQIGGPGASNHSKSDDKAKTSCTRRYKGSQHISYGGVPKEVESIFIPHGAVIFACHKVGPPRSPYLSIQQGPVGALDMYNNYQPRQPVASSYPPLHALVQGHHTSDTRRSASAGDYSAPGVPGSPEYAHSRSTSSGYQRGPAEYSASQYAVRGVDYAHGSYVQSYPPYPAPANPHIHPSTDHRNSQDRGEGWGYPQSRSQHPAQPPWPAPASSPRPASPRGPSSYEGQSWMITQGWTQGPMERAPAPQPAYPYSASQPFGPPSAPGQPLSPPPPYAPDTPISQPPPPLDTPASAKGDSSPQEEDTTIPRVHAAPKRKRNSVPKREMNDTPDLTQGDGGRSQLSPSTKDGGSRERGSTGATAPRAGGAPPPGVLRCSSCKSETSPEWRKGPSGKKDLCNACGLRYARSKQKKDGNTQPKRRREKEVPRTPAPVPIPGGAPSSLPQSSHGPLSASASTSSGSAPPSWPSALHDGREQKRMRNGTFTSASHSPSPPRSEGRSQPETYSEPYGARYGQTIYPQGHTNGYPMDYTRIPGSVPPYVSPELNDRTYPEH
ncbi:unnamed protein product [Rhizoctonia solani]|uniref:GATA-type domain-containing protein n=1 Tax=Rhizoctonia solani TaxID=456999 RepID=A0A8H3AHK0_9AGAM|nr:unnamed protein product [Rhizoctonia solani]CAE6426236.1 unnamed protein product [Rhizoctonia solani]